MATTATTPPPSAPLPLPLPLISPASPKPSLVNLNVREVLEKSAVEDAKEISRKVNLEIERKKEELRMLVGERYRDLIDAADTIGTMSTSSVSVFEKLTMLREKFNSFPAQLATVKTPKEFTEKRRLNESELEIASNLKLLLEVPRQTHVALDKKEIVAAVHLSTFYDKILYKETKPYKWSFLANSGQNSEQTAESISSSILLACEDCLKDFHCPNERIATCHIAKQILGKSSCQQVLEEFLAMRVSGIKDALMEKDSNFVNHIAATVQGIYAVFIDPQLYNTAAKQMKKPNLSALNFGVKFTTKSVLQFSQQNLPIEEPPRATTLAETVLRHFVHPLKTVLDSCYSSKIFMSEEKNFQELNDYRNNISSKLKKQTDDLMRIVLGTSKSLWGEAFHPVFQEKCQTIGGNWVHEIFKFLDQDAFPRFQKLDDQFDLVSFVWKPPAINEKSNQYLNVDLKLNCLSPHMAGLCGELEEQFQELLKDFQTLGDTSVKDFISSSIVKEVKEFLQKKDASKNLFLGKFCTAMTDLCGTFWKLINASDKTAMRQIISAKCEECWMAWSNEVVQQFAKNLETKMPDLSPYSVASFMPVAEEFTSQGDEGVKPSIQVPLQLSHTLHSLLFQICVDIAKVGPQSIPKPVRESIREHLGQKVHSVYTTLLEKTKEKGLKEKDNSEEKDSADDESEEKLIAQVASQLIFDLKFCQWFHPTLSDLIKPLIDVLQSVIDPFDMDIVFPRMKDNLKRFLFETHLTLGLLFSEESHSFIAQNFKTKQNQSYPHGTSVSVLLPLLPI